MKQGVLQHEGISPTAATVGSEIQYPKSGAMDYLVVLVGHGGARNGVVVNAETGDDAATQALAKNPGSKVSYVGPSEGFDARRLSDEAA